jgi:hypothetical protein
MVCAPAPEAPPTVRPVLFRGCSRIGPALAQGGFKGRFAAEKQENSALGPRSLEDCGDAFKRDGSDPQICESLLTWGHFRKEMAGATGLEPATFGVTGRHSNQLSYAPAYGSQRAPREGGRCTGATLPCQAISPGIGYGGGPPPRRRRRCCPSCPPSVGGCASGEASSRGLAPARCSSLGVNLPSWSASSWSNNE